MADRGRALVGITGWTEPTLIKEGTFYPKEAKTAESRLRFYADQFPIVEVDSTYYFPPSERNAVLWIERTPKDFTFNVKAYSLLTNHPTRPDSLYKDLRESLPAEALEKRSLYRENLPDEVVDEVWQRFHDALMPLHSAGKLGAVLFQFPAWFTISRKNKLYIADVAERLEDFRVAVEFRHKSWLEERNVEETMSLLEHHRLPYVCVDMPQGFDSSLPPVAAVTADDIAMVRFHGRNRETWTARTETAAYRFDYRYEPGELAEWGPRVEQLREQAKETHVLFNNCYRDYAVVNARQMASMLDE
jgi:uncharacterized protein YecE (DUF72 family)